jgi:hypothetical protein|tara:strand:- start:13400 stop:13876 length:477 start_codon:yes stop_codon:yes gene_type:complete
MKKSVSTINQNELERLTTSFEKGDFINLVTLTKVKMNKKNNPYFDKVFKTSKKNVRLLPDYEKRKQKTNPTFEVKENWFEHISDCVVKHRNNDNKYLMIEGFENVHTSNDYEFNGNEIFKDDFETYLPTYQSRDVNVMTIKLDNIKSITYKGVKYEIE